MLLASRYCRQKNPNDSSRRERERERERYVRGREPDKVKVEKKALVERSSSESGALVERRK